MTMMTLAEAHALVPDSKLIGDWLTGIERVHSDTRTLQPGDLFVALKGERFDAHDFLREARAAGAAAAISSRPLDEAGLPGLLVPDTLAALQQLAHAWRIRFAVPLVAVTGSNGKTTVTQMIASILRAWVGADAALATAGNLNNHIGVPLTLLRLRDVHRTAVIELGMNHPGEIAELSQPGAADRRAGQQRAARAPGVHGQRRGGGARERRGDRLARPHRHGGVPGRRCACAAVARARRGAAGAHLRAARHRRRHVHRHVACRALGARAAHAGGRRAGGAARRRRAQRAGTRSPPPPARSPPARRSKPSAAASKRSSR